MAQHSGRGCVVLVNSTYNLSYLSPFCSSYLPSPAFPSQPPMSSFSYPLTHVVLFILSSHSPSLIRTRSHTSPFFAFVFLLVLPPPPPPLLLFGVNSFTYLQVFFFSRGRVSALLSRSTHIFLSPNIYMYISRSHSHSLTHSFSLSLPRNF